MVMCFKFSNVDDHFPLQNSRLSVFERGGFDVDIGGKWDPHMALVESTQEGHRKYMEKHMETHDKVF